MAVVIEEITARVVAPAAGETKAAEGAEAPRAAEAPRRLEAALELRAERLARVKAD